MPRLRKIPTNKSTQLGRGKRQKDKTFFVEALHHRIILFLPQKSATFVPLRSFLKAETRFLWERTISISSFRRGERVK